MKKAFGFVVVLGAFVACGGGGTSKKPCTDDQSCGRGFVCESGSCTQKECTLDQDCGPSELSRVCVNIPPPAPGFDQAKKYCTRIECNESSPCPNSTDECKDFLCVLKPTSGDVLDALEAEVDALPQDGLNDAQGEEVTVPQNTSDCKPCQTGADCDQGYSCMPLAGGKFCLKDCTGNADCKGGFICYQVVSPGPKSCIPISYKCQGCASAGCDQGKCCDLVSGECKDCKQKCDLCRYDFECAQGMRCYIKQGGSTGNCVYECGQTQKCDEPDKFACQDNGQGIKVCVPTSDQSCVSCPSDKPYLGSDNQCHQCLLDQHCKSGQVCNQQTYTCETPGCPSGTYKCSDGQCHQCCEDKDCVGVPGATGKCVNFACEGAQDPCHGTCADPYPVCANVQGQWQCVQCAQDADCKLPNCKCSNFLCVDASTGQVCTTGPGSCAAQCTTDQDCPTDANNNQLACNQTYKICYNPNGGCDGQAACCAPNQQCVDLLSLLFGGLGGLPGGMPMGTGYCSCNTQNDCLGGEPCTNMSLLCALPFIGQMVCPNGSLPPTVPQNMCFDISKLLGGLGGI